MPARKESSLYQQLFTTKNGEIVMGQSPNLAIIIACIAAVLAIPTAEIFRSLFILLAFGCFFVWSWQELFDGVNLFRRITGGIALGATVAVALLASNVLHLF